MHAVNRRLRDESKKVEPEIATSAVEVASPQGFDPHGLTVRRERALADRIRKNFKR
jgi:hypothetical protein